MGKKNGDSGPPRWKKVVRPKYPNLSNPKKTGCGHRFFVRMKNRVEFGFIFLGSRCLNFRLNSGLFKCPDPIFLA